MANIIAVIWDCDKTLIDGYMQDPIFEDYKVNSGDFWREVNSVPEQYAQKGIRVNKDTYYLNHFIKCAHNGTFPGLNNQKLTEYGSKQRFYKGIPEIFEYTKNMFKDDKTYAEYGIQVPGGGENSGHGELHHHIVIIPGLAQQDAAEIARLAADETAVLIFPVPQLGIPNLTPVFVGLIVQKNRGVVPVNNFAQ